MNKTSNLIKILPLLFFHVVLFGQTVNYNVSQDIIANPERGLQKYSMTSSDYASVQEANNLSVSTLEGWKNSSDKVTVVYRHFLLDAFLNANINSIFLDNIQTDFDNIRAAGLKVIVRFSYSNTQPTGVQVQQASKAQILAHIDQIAPLLANNEDVIFSHQAGFIGTWGEWYYTNSAEFGTTGTISAAQWDNRKEIVDAMLDATPVGIPLQVRYAQIKQVMYGTTELTELTAYENTANARIGFFNDAFLNDWGDQGTYSISSQCQSPVGTAYYNYVANETQFLPMTGETNGLNVCDNGYRTTGANAITEMELTHWTTINRDYYTPFWDNVINSNHYDEIVRRLGYRFILNSSTVAVNATDFDLTLELENVGFGRVFKQRDVYLVLEDIATNNIITRQINTDIRSWERSETIVQNFDMGVSGTFKLYLWIPDSEPTLQANSDYSIQFTNTGTWDSQTGYNDLLQTVTLGTTASTGDMEVNRISIYPNPAKEYLTIEVFGGVEEQVSIYNSLGQILMELPFCRKHFLDVSVWEEGVYFVCLGENKQQIQKVVIVKD